MHIEFEILISKLEGGQRKLNAELSSKYMKKTTKLKNQTPAVTHTDGYVSISDDKSAIDQKNICVRPISSHRMKFGIWRWKIQSTKFHARQWFGWVKGFPPPPTNPFSHPEVLWSKQTDGWIWFSSSVFSATKHREKKSTKMDSNVWKKSSYASTKRKWKSIIHSSLIA